MLMLEMVTLAGAMRVGVLVPLDWSLQQRKRWRGVDGAMVSPWSLRDCFLEDV